MTVAEWAVFKLNRLKAKIDELEEVADLLSGVLGIDPGRRWQVSYSEDTVSPGAVGGVVDAVGWHRLIEHLTGNQWKQTGSSHRLRSDGERWNEYFAAPNAEVSLFRNGIRVRVRAAEIDTKYDPASLETMVGVFNTFAKGLVS